jgi:hypothetical protein
MGGEVFPGRECGRKRFGVVTENGKVGVVYQFRFPTGFAEEAFRPRISRVRPPAVLRCEMICGYASDFMNVRFTRAGMSL